MQIQRAEEIKETLDPPPTSVLYLSLCLTPSAKTDNSADFAHLEGKENKATAIWTQRSPVCPL